MENTLDQDIDAARSMLLRASWAASTFERYDHDRVRRIVESVAEVAFQNARLFAEMAVQETGFGVVADKVLKNEGMSLGFVETHGNKDFSTPRFDEGKKLIHIPRPAGVIYALTPSTSPVSAVYFKVLSSLLTRSAVIISPHPAALDVCIRAVNILSDAATKAGAPAGAVQVLRKPTIPLAEAIMREPMTKLILATGGLGVVQSAYRSGTPALGVGPGNPPALVDATANLARAAQDIVRSKSFDNGVLCTTESVLVLIESVADQMLSELRKEGAHLCTDSETQLVREFIFPSGRFNPKAIGISAAEIAASAGLSVPAQTKVLLTPIKQCLDEEPLTHEKLCPVLALRIVPDVRAGIAESRALLRIVGQGHSAVIHSEDPTAVLMFSSSLPAHRISVNVPGSLGSAGFGTTLPTTMSVGTGFIGGSSSGENLQPEDLVQWSRVGFSDDPSVSFPRFPASVTGTLYEDLPLLMPPYPVASNASSTALTPSAPPNGLGTLDRAALRRLVREELANMVGSR